MSKRQCGREMLPVLFAELTDRLNSVLVDEGCRADDVDDRSKFQSFLEDISAKVREAQVECVRSEAEFEKDIRNAFATQEEVKNELDSVKEERDGLRKVIQAYIKETDQLRQSLIISENRCIELEAKERRLISSYETENEKRRKAERDLERKDSEIEHLNGECRLYERKLGLFSQEKSELLAEKTVAENQNRDLSRREADWETQRQVMMQELGAVRDELSRVTKNLLTHQIESSQKINRLECENGILKTEAEQYNDTIGKLNADLSSLESRCMHLGGEAGRLKANYAVQLKECADQVNDLRNQVVRESELRSAAEYRYKQGLEDVQRFQQESRDYEEVNERLRQYCNDLRNQLAECEQKEETKVRALETELKNANDLLQVVSPIANVSDLSNVSDNAALVSQLLSPDLSFTTIYSRYIELHRRLDGVVHENERLKNAHSAFVKRLHDQAPVLQRQRVDIENAYRTINELRECIAELRQELSNSRDANASKLRRTNGLLRENAILREESRELSEQVRSLIKEIAVSRGEEVNLEDGDRGYVSIEELHEANVQLRRRVREMEASSLNITEPEQSSDAHIKVKWLNERLEVLTQEMIAYKASIETLTKQRDAYKELSEDACRMQTNAGDDDSRIIQNLRNEVERKTMELAALHKDQQAFHDRISLSSSEVMEKLDEFKKDMENKVVMCAELNGVIKNLEEKCKFYEGHESNLRIEISGWTQRYRKLSDSFIRLQNTNVTLNASLVGSSERISELEVQRRSFEAENTILQCKVRRLKEELDMTKTQWISNQSLQDTISSMRSALTENERSNRYLIEKQVASLETRLQESNDRLNAGEALSREMSVAHQEELDKVTAMMNSEREENMKLRNELNENRDRVVKLAHELTECQSELVAARLKTKSTGEIVDQIGASELELEDWRAKVHLLEEELESQQCLRADLMTSLEDQKRLSENLDKALTDQVEQYERRLKDIESTNVELKKVIEQKEDLLSRVQQEYLDFSEDAKRRQNAFSEKESSWCKRSAETIEMMNTLNERLSLMTDEKDRLAGELKTQCEENERLAKKVDENRVAFNELHCDLETKTRNNEEMVEDAIKLKEDIRVVSCEAEQTRTELKELTERFSAYRESYETMVDEYKRDLEKQPNEIQKLIDFVVEMRGSSGNEEGGETNSLVELHKALTNEQIKLRETLTKVSAENDQLQKTNLELEQKFKSMSVESVFSVRSELEVSLKNVRDLTTANSRLLEENQKLLDENTRLLLRQPSSEKRALSDREPSEKREEKRVKSEESSLEATTTEPRRTTNVVRPPIEPIVWTDTSIFGGVGVPSRYSRLGPLRGQRRPRMRRGMDEGHFRRPGNGGGVGGGGQF